MHRSHVRVRFRNDGGKNVARGEAHLVYRTPNRDGTRVTFGWKDDSGDHIERREIKAKSDGIATSWSVPTGKGTVTKWVGLEPAYAQ